MEGITFLLCTNMLKSTIKIKKALLFKLRVDSRKPNAIISLIIIIIIITIVIII